MTTHIGPLQRQLAYVRKTETAKLVYSARMWLKAPDFQKPDHPVTIKTAQDLHDARETIQAAVDEFRGAFAELPSSAKAETARRKMGALRDQIMDTFEPSDDMYFNPMIKHATEDRWVPDLDAAYTLLSVWDTMSEDEKLKNACTFGPSTSVRMEQLVTKYRKAKATYEDLKREPSEAITRCDVYEATVQYIQGLDQGYVSEKLRLRSHDGTLTLNRDMVLQLIGE